jgi:hypothetical protein
VSHIKLEKCNKTFPEKLLVHKNVVALSSSPIYLLILSNTQNGKNAKYVDMIKRTVYTFNVTGLFCLVKDTECGAACC